MRTGFVIAAGIAVAGILTFLFLRDLSAPVAGSGGKRTAPAAAVAQPAQAGVVQQAAARSAVAREPPARDASLAVELQSDDSVRVAGRVVGIRAQDGGDWTWSRTDAQGRVTFSGLLAATYQLASEFGHWQDAQAGSTVTLHAGTTTIQGKVAQFASGEPVGGCAGVLLFGSEDDCVQVPTSRTSDVAGVLAFDGLVERRGYVSCEPRSGWSSVDALRDGFVLQCTTTSWSRWQAASTTRPTAVQSRAPSCRCATACRRRR
jgi:hypothetical protein